MRKIKALRKMKSGKSINTTMALFNNAAVDSLSGVLLSVSLQAGSWVSRQPRAVKDRTRAAVQTKQVTINSLAVDVEVC